MDHEQNDKLVESYYDKARGLGLDILKVVVGTSIAIAGVPILSFDRVKQVFPGALLQWILASWVFVLLTLMLGFWTFFLLFEGYYNFALQEESRLILRKEKETQKHWKQSNRFFNLSLTLLVS